MYVLVEKVRVGAPEVIISYWFLCFNAEHLHTDVTEQDSGALANSLIAKSLSDNGMHCEDNHLHR